jgi:DNA invertase Pin-like site-specific DNA recombinase
MTRIVVTTAAEIDALFHENSTPVWGYARVSTARQAEEGVSLDAQVEAIEAYCKAKGLSAPVIVQEQASAGTPMLAYSLPGTSLAGGATASPRPLLTALMGHITALGRSRRVDGGEPPHLVFYRQDRLSRVGREVEMLLTLLDRSGVEIHSTEEPNLYDNSDPVRVLVREILGLFAQYERSSIIQRSRAGMIQKESTGGWIGGKPPLGYRHKSGELCLSQSTAEHEAVRLVFSLRAAGLSYAQIAKAGKLEIPSLHWYKSLVVRILGQHALYCGRVITRGGKVVARPDLRILGPEWDDRPAAPYTDPPAEVDFPTDTVVEEQSHVQL